MCSTLLCDLDGVVSYASQLMGLWGGVCVASMVCDRSSSLSRCCGFWLASEGRWGEFTMGSWRGSLGCTDVGALFVVGCVDMVGSTWSACYM